MSSKHYIKVCPFENLFDFLAFKPDFTFRFFLMEFSDSFLRHVDAVEVGPTIFYMQGVASKHNTLRYEMEKI